jgi:hypothetical protein
MTQSIPLLMKRYSVSLALCALLILALFSAGGHLPQSRAQENQLPPLPLISVPSFGNGKILMPRSRETLQVQVADRNGRPLSNVSVLFIAPESGPGGSFVGATPAGAGFIRTRTNASGMASAMFIANETPGVYLVDAIVEEMDLVGIQATTSFAMTNVTRQVRPRLAADQARRAVMEQLLLNTVLDETLQLHGPVLVDVGTRVAPARPESPFSPTTPMIIDKLAWFFWVDEHPYAQFVHPTRFVTLDASASRPNLTRNAVLTREEWWPEVTLPGATRSISLLPPSHTNNTVIFQSSAQSRAPDLGSNEAVLPLTAGEVDSCAIVITGSLEYAYKLDVDNMKAFFKDPSGPVGVPRGNIFSTTDAEGNTIPSSVADLDRFLKMAKDQRCKKLYLYIAGHGSDGYMSLQGTDLGLFGYNELARRLAILGDTNTELCIIIQSCHAGSAIPDLQGYGVNGTVVTASDRESLSWSTRTGGAYFTDALIKCWRDPKADDDGDGKVTLREAYVWVLTNLPTNAVAAFQYALTIWGLPQFAFINGRSTAFPLPDVRFPKVGETDIIMIRRPAGVPRDMEFRFKLRIEDPAVATFPGGDSEDNAVLPAGQDVTTPPDEVRVTSQGEGRTPYRAFGGEDDKFLGVATIYVGSGYYVVPNPVRLKVGETVMVKLFRTNVIRMPRRVQVLITPENFSTIAKPTPETVIFEPDETEKDFSITGLRRGSTMFEMFDALYGLTSSFKVIVEGTRCIPDGTYDVQFTVKSDPDGHHAFINLQSATLRILTTTDQVLVRSADPLPAEAAGAFDRTCPFEAVGPATVAGEPNVRVEYRDVIVEGNTIRGCCVIGAAEELGKPITYGFTGTRR